jgi:hypothetical protein
LRRVLTRRALVAGSALLVVACGCSSGGGTTAPTTTLSAPAPTTTTTSTTTPTTVTFPGPPLEPLVLEDAPSGYERKPDTLADTGFTDLSKAVRDDALSPEADARQALVSAGFLRGYQRQWSTEPAVSQNFIYVYQFATPEGAAQYLSHWSAVATGGAGASRPAPVPFTPTVPGWIGLKADDALGSSGVVLFSKGPYAVQAVSTGAAGVDQADPTTALAFAQFARLP